MNYHKSRLLSWLKNDIRTDAINEQDEELRDKFWRWYYRAKDAEFEVHNMVQQADVRRLLEYAVKHKWISPDVLNSLPPAEESEPPEAPEPKPKKSRRKKSSDDDDNLPKQKGLWD